MDKELAEAAEGVDFDFMLASALHNVTYHAVRDSRQDDMEKVREAAKGFLGVIAAAMDSTSPRSSREKAMAFRAVEDAVMYAVAGIARHGGTREPQEGWL